MGDVIQFPTRHGSPTGLVDRDTPPEQEPDDLPAGPNDSSADLTSTDTRPATAPRVPRPEWLGVRRKHRRAAGTAVSRFLRTLGSRLVFELVQGLPRRGVRCVRWFFRGVVGHRDPSGNWIGGWVGLIGWCFAARERQDARDAAVEQPGRQITATEHADRLAWWHSGFLVVPHLIGAVAIQHHLPGYWWLVFTPLVIGTIIYGYRTDPKPPDPIAAPRMAGNITADAINDALRAVGMLTKPTTSNPHPDRATLARVPKTVGSGQEIVIDLPASVKASAADVIRERERIAASLAIPASQLVIEPGDHAGRVVLWCADRDPFTRDPEPTPLLDHVTWSIFDRVPFGHDPRSEPVSAPLFETHWLIGGLPGSGKTSAARAVTAAAVLDPHTELFVFDGKQGGDWAAIENAATVFDAGPIRSQAAHLRALLERFLAEGDARFHEMRRMSAARCPDNALTPELAADGMRFRFLVVDEFHRHLADEQHGAAITTLLRDYVKGYRACGFGLLLATQDTAADIADRFTSLRRVIGTRFALRVMDWAASNMILGDQMNTRGHDASLILPAQRGTGILRTDLETDTGITRLARTVRCYWMGAAEWRAVCNTAAEVRQLAAEQAEPLEDAEPDELLSATALLARLQALAPEALPAGVTTAKGLGEYLSSVGTRAEGQNAAGQRVRSRLLVEVAVGLPEGSLRVADGGSPSGPAATVSNPVSDLGEHRPTGTDDEDA